MPENAACEPPGDEPACFSSAAVRALKWGFNYYCIQASRAMQDGGAKVKLRTVYLHPGPSLRRLILRSKGLVNNGSIRKGGRRNLPFKNLKVGIALYEDISTPGPSAGRRKNQTESNIVQLPPSPRRHRT